MSREAPITTESKVIEIPIKELELPLSEKAIEQLRAGEFVYLNGPLYLISPKGASLLQRAIREGQLEGIQIENSTFFIGKPGVTPVGKVSGSIRPSYSMNYHSLLKELLERKARCIIGRGPLPSELHNSLKKKHSVYAITIDGAGALLARTVYNAQLIALRENEELGKEGIKLLKVKKFPAIIAMDSFGRNKLNQWAGVDKNEKES